MEDVSGCENELQGTTTGVPTKPSPSNIFLPAEVITYVTLKGVEQEVLKAYAKEYTVPEDFEDVDRSLRHVVDRDDMSQSDMFSSHSSTRSRVDIRPSRSHQLGLGPIFRCIYIALTIIPVYQRVLNVRYFIDILFT